MADPTLLLAWLVLAHLVGDFLLQTDAIATGKFGDGPPAARALWLHAGVVAAVHLPLVVIFGLRGFLFVALTAASHFVIDRAKIVLTRRAEPLSPSGSDPTAEEAATGPAFDRAWTPVPGALFAFDQLAHLSVLLLGWTLLLGGATPMAELGDIVQRLSGNLGPEAFHRVALTAVVISALLIVNVRAASLFVAMLVRPPGKATDATRPSVARVGSTIGILERLLICALVLGGAVATIGLVVAAKTLARFKQLDDREFAEYYLLGTLASVTIAVATSLIAQSALATA
ncbi:MAG: DUF3307 domain-containing protein [Chloroflexi bacterium]|nr:DUF3307 domain-containing protein [Chloroflexota bacterium]MDQ3449143.1 DUF3307 domain-containing protein [Chloroflexota bacterium]